MQSRRLLVVAIAAFASLPLMAQQVGASGQTSSSASPAGAAQGAARGSGVDDTQMQPVSGELVSRLNSKSARVGEPVVLKTTEKTQIAGGVVIPKGSRLLGHVTQVQAHDKKNEDSWIGIEFDRAALKNGQSFAIHSQIESVSLPQSMITEDENAASNAFNGPGPNGPAFAGSHVSGTATAGTQLAGHGLVGDAVLNANLNGGQMGPGSGTMPTGIPGVGLSGEASGSALSAAKKNFRLDPGTQMVIGVVAAGK
jgi:hypothetical protein